MTQRGFNNSALRNALSAPIPSDNEVQAVEVQINGKSVFQPATPAPAAVPKAEEHPLTAVALREQVDIETLHAALHIGNAFTVEAKRPEPEQTRRLLSWHKGLNLTRGGNGERMANYAGWAIEVPLPENGVELSPDDENLLNALEVLYASAHPDGTNVAAPIVVQHKGDEESQGKPRTVHYCALSQASLYVVCEGIPSNTQMRASIDNRWGIAYGWQSGKSALQFQVFVKELVEAGYFEPFLCTFHGPITEMVLMALRHQNRVLAVADKLRSEQGFGALLPYYAYDLPTRVSAEPRTVGRDDKTQQIFFPVAQVPAVITPVYLAQHATSDDVAALIEQDDRVTRASAWSVSTSKKIEEGDASAVTGEAGTVAVGAGGKQPGDPF